MNKEVSQRLTPFIPKNLRLDILATLWQEYRDREVLAREIGCKPSVIDSWLKNGKAPNDKHMPRILSLALQISPRAREMLRVEVLEQVENLFAALNIFPEKSDGDLGKILDVVDEKSRQILWYLWWRRHAEIGELAQLTGAESDMDIISRIKGVINAAAQDVLGKEIVRFKSSRIDPLTGEKVLFSWWLEEGSLSEKRTEPLVDVFEENDHIAVIAQLPAPRELAKEARVECRDGILRVRVGKLESWR